MKCSRRTFIEGAALLGAWSSGRLLAAPPGMLSGGRARLIFGVVSDIHVVTKPNGRVKCGDTRDFEAALRWFDEQGVDAVVIAGDMSHDGFVDQLQSVGDAWFRVFPKNRSHRDGRFVEKLFVYGNHDVEGQFYTNFRKNFPDDESYRRALIATDRAKAWQNVFHEPYLPIWHKTVRGYDFVGAHWGPSWEGIPDVEDWFRENGHVLGRSRPFFYIQHPHPGGTVYGADAWGADRGYAKRALARFPNAVAFSGHSHESLTDERSIWQGEFTSVAAASLRYGGEFNDPQQRQGLLVKVYDNRIVFERRDFERNASLAADWVLPVPCRDPKPYSFAVRASEGRPPAFAASAKLKVERDAQGWRLTIPCANEGLSRPLKYEIAAGLKKRDGKPGVFTVFDAGYHKPRVLAGVPTTFLVKADLFVEGANPCFTVTPLDCFGIRGLSIG